VKFDVAVIVTCVVLIDVIVKPTFVRPLPVVSMDPMTTDGIDVYTPVKTYVPVDESLKVTFPASTVESPGNMSNS
jgi:hypothetical protein